MKAKVNYLYPLATQRQLQWTKDVVKGENPVARTIRPKNFSAARKDIIRNVIKDKKGPSRSDKPIRTRNVLNPTLKANPPTDPMRTPDPRPGNAMHITNSKGQYLGYN